MAHPIYIYIYMREREREREREGESNTNIIGNHLCRFGKIGLELM